MHKLEILLLQIFIIVNLLVLNFLFFDAFEDESGFIKMNWYRG